jgi:replicative DNA helicase
VSVAAQNDNYRFVPPHDLETEAALLGAIVVDSKALDTALEMLQPEHFYAGAHGLIFAACRDLEREKRAVDLIQVSAKLRTQQRLDQIGGLGYLTELLDRPPSTINVADYARTVHEKWLLRQMIATCQRIAAEGYSYAGDVRLFLEQCEQKIYAIAHVPDKRGLTPLRDVIKASFEKISANANRAGAVFGLPTGFDRFDRVTSGLHDGELTIVAARPGMGKTSFVLNLAANVARPKPFVDPHDPNVRWSEPGVGVAIFTLEMPSEQIGNRILCCEGRVEVSKIRGGALGGEDWRRLTSQSIELYQLPVWIDDTSAISLLELRAKVRRQKAMWDQIGTDGKPTQRLGLVIIDYLQLMSGRGTAGNREQEISELSRGLKGLAKELGLPVVALSQLNRQVEARADKRPMISDLRESGAIEQDADNILFIYRDEYYTKALCKTPGVVELIVAKQRNGPTGTALLRWEGAYTRFDNLPEGEYPEDP